MSEKFVCPICGGLDCETVRVEGVGLKSYLFICSTCSGVFADLAKATETALLRSMAKSNAAREVEKVIQGAVNTHIRSQHGGAGCH